MQEAFVADTYKVEIKPEIGTDKVAESNPTNQLEVSITDMNPEQILCHIHSLSKQDLKELLKVVKEELNTHVQNTN